MHQADYEALEGINYSRLKLLKVSPLHFLNAKERVLTAALAFGLAVHCRILEPDEFDFRFCVYDGPVRRGKAWEAFRDARPSQMILTEAEMRRSAECAAAVLSHPVAKKRLSAGLPENVIRWTDRETGVVCKGRVDLVNDRVVDLKTTRDISPRRFATQAAQLGYPMQLAFYHDGLLECGHEPMEDPSMIVVESERPYDVVVYDVPKHVIEMGRNEYRGLLRLYKECDESRYWPGIAPQEPLVFSMPEWAEAEALADEPMPTMGGEEMA